jgi:hypothetical protein
MSIDVILEFVFDVSDDSSSMEPLFICSPKGLLIT